MKIKLKAKHPEYISPQLMDDTLAVYFLVDMVSQDRHYLSTNPVFGKIPKQMPDNSLSQGFIDATFASKQVLKFSLVVTGALNLLFSQAFSIMLVMVNALQLTLHLPIMNIVFPENAMTYISTLFPIVMFDVLEDNQWFNDLFGKDVTPRYNIRTQVQDLGYDSHNPFLNLGTITLFFATFLCGVILTFSVLWPLKSFVTRVEKAYVYMVKKLFFSVPIAICLECFFELLMSSILVFKVPQDSYENKAGYKIFGVGIILACILLPVLIVWILKQEIHRLN